jgi:hypothetical protein
MDSSVSYISGLPQLLLLTVAFTAGLIAILSHRYRQRTSALANVHASAAPGKIVYSDAPTIQVSDAQRVDRIRKVVRLAAGEHVDILEPAAGLPPRFRITLKTISRREGSDAAHLAVQLGGTRIGCGPLVEELGPNEFRVPRAAGDEPRSVLFHYHESGSALEFMRIKVRSLHPDEGNAALDVLHVRGHWSAAH